MKATGLLSGDVRMNDLSVVSDILILSVLLNKQNLEGADRAPIKYSLEFLRLS